MRDAALLIFALLLLGSAILLLLFLRYRHSPAVLWYARVLRRRADLQAQKAELLAPPASSVARLADELFRRHLDSISVISLLSQPGVGPATVDKLTAAGRRTLADVQQDRFESLPGLGLAKAAEVRAAVATLTAEARGRFDAGACPEGVEFRKRVQALNTEEVAKGDERAQAVAAIDDVLEKLDRLEEIAKDVSFWNGLFHQTVPGLTDAVLHAETR